MKYIYSSNTDLCTLRHTAKASDDHRVLIYIRHICLMATVNHVTHKVSLLISDTILSYTFKHIHIYIYICIQGSWIIQILIHGGHLLVKYSLQAFSEGLKMKKLTFCILKSLLLTVTVSNFRSLHSSGPLSHPFNCWPEIESWCFHAAIRNSVSLPEIGS